MSTCDKFSHRTRQVSRTCTCVHTAWCQDEYVLPSLTCVPVVELVEVQHDLAHALASAREAHSLFTTESTRDSVELLALAATILASQIRYQPAMQDESLLIGMMVKAFVSRECQLEYNQMTGLAAIIREVLQLSRHDGPF